MGKMGKKGTSHIVCGSRDYGLEWLLGVSEAIKREELGFPRSRRSPPEFGFYHYDADEIAIHPTGPMVAGTVGIRCCQNCLLTEITRKP